MAVRLRCLLVAAPLAMLVGAALALAATAEAGVTARDREMVARPTRGGVPRFDADGIHGAADAIDAAVAGTPSSAPGQPVRAAARASLPRPHLVTRLDSTAAGRRAGGLPAPPARGRAPPRR
jgi:hypothetical protein